MSQRRALVLEIWCAEAAGAAQHLGLDWLAAGLAGWGAVRARAARAAAAAWRGVAWRGVAAGSEPLKPYLA
mgnify:CR=1 FL=1